MAERPVFIPNERKGPFVRKISIEFKWYPGFAITQKRKSIEALHEGAKHKGIHPVLEISTKSENSLGTALSAFNLSLRFKNGRTLTVEQAYQGSKVFEGGGPYTEFYEMKGRQIKKDPRLKESGNLTGFNLMGIEWSLEPATAFYDWLYIHALGQNSELSKQVINFAGFSDIAFNPKKSLNCQARSAALYVSLCKNNLLKEALSGKSVYLEVIKVGIDPELKKHLLEKAGEPRVKEDNIQYELFG